MLDTSKITEMNQGNIEELNSFLQQQEKESMHNVTRDLSGQFFAMTWQLPNLMWTFAKQYFDVRSKKLQQLNEQLINQLVVVTSSYENLTANEFDEVMEQTQDMIDQIQQQQINDKRRDFSKIAIVGSGSTGLELAKTVMGKLGDDQSQIIEQPTLNDCIETNPIDEEFMFRKIKTVDQIHPKKGSKYHK